MNRRTALHAASTLSLPPWVRLFEGETGGGGGVIPPTPPAPVPTPPPAPAPTPPAPGPGGPPSPNGFPENTALADMTVEQRESYWKHHARRHEDAWKARGTELDALRPKAEQYDATVEAQRTEAEKAVAAAEQRGTEAGRVAAEAAALAKYGSSLVQSRFESVLAGRLAPEQVATLVGGLNVTAFLGADGLPDTQKITDFAAAIPGPAAPAPVGGPRNLGGGRTPGSIGGGDDMDAVFARRHPKAKVPNHSTF